MSSKLHVVLSTYGLSRDEILSTQKYIHRYVSDNMNEDFELVDIGDILNEDNAAGATPNQRARHIGALIQKLSEADVVAFAKNWQDSKECIIQHFLCAILNIPYVETGVTYFDAVEDAANQVVDYTTDRDEAARINNVLSEEYEHDVLLMEHDDSNDEDIDGYGIDDLEPGEYNADISSDDNSDE